MKSSPAATASLRNKRLASVSARRLVPRPIRLISRSPIASVGACGARVIWSPSTRIARRSAWIAASLLRGGALPALRSPWECWRVALHTAPMEEGAKGAGQYPHGRYRVCLEEDVQGPGRRRDRVRKLGGDSEELGAGPEQGVPQGRDLGALCVPLEEEDQHAGDGVQDDRGDEEEGESRAQVPMRGRGRACDLHGLATSHAHGLGHAGSLSTGAVGQPTPRIDPG